MRLCTASRPALVGLLSMLLWSAAAPAQQKPSETQAETTRALAVTVQLPATHAAGTLVVGWKTAAEAADGANRGQTLTKEIQRFVTQRVGAGVSQVQVTLPTVSAEPVQAYAVLDTTEQFWLSMWGGRGEGNWQGKVAVPAASASTTVTLDKALAVEDTAERCTGERYRVVPLPDVDPKSSTGVRNLCVHLPPGYSAEGEKRYPVIFVTPGLFSSHTSKMVGGGSYPPLADDAGHDVILVGVDTRHSVGSVYFTDAPATGDFITWMRDVVIPAVDTTFRTTKNPDERGVIGGSTGGFNALRLAQLLPEHLGAAAVLKPDGLDFETWLLDEGKLRPLWLSWMRLEDAVGGPGQLSSYAAHFSPDPQATRGYAWPVDLNTGVPNEAWAKWLAYSPASLLRAEDDTAAAFRRRFDGRLFFAVGENDEFGLAAPTQRFCDALDDVGMGYRLRVDEGGHFSHAEKRQAAGLRFLMRTFARPRSDVALPAESRKGTTQSDLVPTENPEVNALAEGDLNGDDVGEVRLPSSVRLLADAPPLRWYGFFGNVSAGTKNIGVGMAFRYLGVAQTNLSTDFLMTSLINGLTLDDLDAFRLSASQTLGFRIHPWPFKIDWRNVAGQGGAIPDIVLGAGGWAVLEVDHAFQYFRQGDAGFFVGTALGVFGSLVFRDVTMSLSWRPVGVTMYWIDGYSDMTPFAIGNPIFDISLTYNLPF